MVDLPFVTVAQAASDVAATSSRTEKADALASVVAEGGPAQAPVVVGLLTGEVRQGRIGVGWAMVRDTTDSRADTATLSVNEIDTALTELMGTAGSGSKARRLEILDDLFERSTPMEADFLAAVLRGGLRQGALDGVMVAGIAKAAGVKQATVRRAAMLSGDLGETAALALSGGSEALEAVGLRVGRGVQPMLAVTAPSVAEAVGELGEVVVQAKLDGIRLQVHRAGDEVSLYTRNLNDVTERLPDVVDLVRAMPADSLVLDGELIGVAEDAPEMFQDTASTFSSGGETGRVALNVGFFDILHRDGVDLIDEPLSSRLDQLRDVVGTHVIATIITSDVDVAERFESGVLDQGHEGVMVKAIDSVYAAGKRGKTWRKVKPVHTYDLVVLAAEWGHGRRQGWLSNLHLGARDGDEFVMVGKTFKGLTDELLAWQTERLLELKDEREGVDPRRDGITVFVRPELVVEIAIDGVQRSTTYEGGLALRFARVKQYRPDKSPAEASAIGHLRALIP